MTYLKLSGRGMKFGKHIRSNWDYLKKQVMMAFCLQFAMNKYPFDLILRDINIDEISLIQNELQTRSEPIIQNDFPETLKSMCSFI